MSHDNIQDFEAKDVAIVPMCAYHDTQLEQVGSHRIFTTVERLGRSRADTYEWTLDLSEVCCITPIPGEGSDTDQEIEKCLDSWYVKISILIR